MAFMSLEIIFFFKKKQIVLNFAFFSFFVSLLTSFTKKRGPIIPYQCSQKVKLNIVGRQIMALRLRKRFLAIFF